MDEETLRVNSSTAQSGIARRNVRWIVSSALEDVEGEVVRSHLLRHSHIYDWSRPLKSQTEKEIILQDPYKVMRIWKRYIT